MIPTVAHKGFVSDGQTLSSAFAWSSHRRMYRLTRRCWYWPGANCQKMPRRCSGRVGWHGGSRRIADVVLDMQANSHAISFIKLIWSFDPNVLEATGMSLTSPFGIIEQLPPTPGVGKVGFGAGAGLNAVQTA